MSEKTRIDAKKELLEMLEREIKYHDKEFEKLVAMKKWLEELTP